MSKRCHHAFPIALMNFGNEVGIDFGSLNTPAQSVSHDLVSEANTVKRHFSPPN